MDERRAGSRAHFIMLALILVSGAGLRLVGLGSQSLWADEALTPVLAYWPTADMILQPTDPTPFLYYFLHKLFIPAGAGVEAVRSISLLAGILSIAAMYLVGRLAFGRGGGLLAAALLAAWPAHIDYSQEARAYSLLFLLTLCSAAGLLWWFHETERDKVSAIGPIPARYLALALFATATTLSFYTHLVSIFWIPLAVQILISVTARTRPKKDVVEAGVAVGLMALFAIPGMIRLVREVSTPDAFHWLPQEGPAGFLRIVANLLLPAGLWDNPWVDGLGAANIVEVAIAMAALAGLALLLTRARRAHPDFAARQPAAMAIILAFLALPLLIWLFGYVARPLFMPRTILFAIPGMILLIVAAIGGFRSERSRTAAAAILVASFLLTVLIHGTVREKEDWRGANAALAGRVRPGDLLIVCPGWKYPAFRHAASGASPAASLIPLEPTPILEEQPFGSDAAWARTYFISVTEPVMRSWIGGSARPHPHGRLILASGAGLWLIGSECGPEEMANIDRRFGPAGGWAEIWRGPATPDHAGIVVARSVVATPIAQEVLLPPAP